MIRREASPTDWILIRQISHAHLAEALARDWNDDFLGPCSRTETLGERAVALAAIRRHDDGWLAFDSVAHPHETTGAPLHFTERSAAEAHEIWLKCIDSVADLAPLGTLMVADHFLNFRRGSDRTDSQDFVARLEPHMHQWRGAYFKYGGTEAKLAERLTRLPFFDDFSLRLCCTPRGPFQLRLENAPIIEVSPEDPAGTHWRLNPWPFTSLRLELATLAARLAKSQVWSEIDWSRREFWSEKIQWTLQPG